ncbi:hypothetical protein U0C82_04165 [Fulvimarina sp. 2208YS6-2-32]|uniref:Uncharacterized protein n=1 Tax=Fulvimarina uroteuthidis TaxID=3098149 RepID=A0ABU5HYZ1_9HYPH|nr:hypothetical protein [Fulvimarina sp. 2208YS6-2-32]MDY8108346.1 hypothetical protein [Fulvimarina sp. 2208YS6-2-32]
MKTIVGKPAIETARRLVASALDQPNIYPQIRSDLMAIANRLGGAGDRVALKDEQSEIVEAYIGLARKRRRLGPADEAALVELARHLA